jgi:hypothetical protein
MSSHRGYSDLDIAHTIVKNSVKRLKELTVDGSKVLLLGRDVWLWAVIGEKMGLRYVYDPRVSRGVAAEHAEMKSILETLDVKNNDIVFDTGFSGTIHRHCQAASDSGLRQEGIFGNRNWLNSSDPFTYAQKERVQLRNLMLSSGYKENQMFPNHGLARNRALFIEYLPKYYKTGFIDRTGRARQELSSVDEIVNCALMTIWAWNYESPSWIKGPVVSRDPNGQVKFPFRKQLFSLLTKEFNYETK